MLQLYYTFWNYENCGENDIINAYICVYLNKNNECNPHYIEHEKYVKSCEYHTANPVNVNDRVVIVFDNMLKEIIKIYDCDDPEINTDRSKYINCKIYSTSVEDNVYKLFDDD